MSNRKKIFIIICILFYILILTGCTVKNNSIISSICIVNTPVIKEYEVNKCNTLYLDGLIIKCEYEDLTYKYICFSNSDIVLSNNVDSINNIKNMRITNNINYQVCGNYNITISIDEKVCDFTVSVKPSRINSEVSDSVEAISIAQNFVLSEYNNVFYEQDFIGPTKLKIISEFSDKSWNVYWTYEPIYDPEYYYVTGRGLPFVKINPTTGEIISFGLQE